MISRLALLFALLFFVSTTFGQEITQLAAEPRGDSVRISYTLEDSDSNRTYLVDLKGIVNGDTIALQQLSGDLGDGISVGQHEVLWDALSELGRFDGSVSFYITALPSFSFTAPGIGETYGRGKPIVFSWYGGNAQEDELLVELYQYDKLLDTLTTLNKVDNYTWKIPNNLPPDGGYRIKLTGGSLSGISEFSNSFTVTGKKKKWYWIAAPIAAILAGGTYLIVSSILPPPCDPENDPRCN
ncbi:MAG: hypothetical protein AAF206_15675 [Bacteroidota bacterium]